MVGEGNSFVTVTTLSSGRSARQETACRYDPHQVASRAQVVRKPTLHRTLRARRPTRCWAGRQIRSLRAVPKGRVPKDRSAVAAGSQSRDVSSCCTSVQNSQALKVETGQPASITKV